MIDCLIVVVLILQATQKLLTRRYEFLRYADGTTFGKFDSCLQSTQVNKSQNLFSSSIPTDKKPIMFLVLRRWHRGRVGL